MGKRLDWILRRDRKKTHTLPQQLYVFALNRQRFESWCHFHGINPRDRDLRVIYTGSFQPHMLQGMMVRPGDKIIVLENADMGYGYQRAREEMAVRTGGWIDIDDLKEVLT